MGVFLFLGKKKPPWIQWIRENGNCFFNATAYEGNKNTINLLGKNCVRTLKMTVSKLLV